MVQQEKDDYSQRFTLVDSDNAPDSTMYNQVYTKVYISVLDSSNILIKYPTDQKKTTPVIVSGEYELIVHNNSVDYELIAQYLSLKGTVIRHEKQTSSDTYGITMKLDLTNKNIPVESGPYTALLTKKGGTQQEVSLDEAQIVFDDGKYTMQTKQPDQYKDLNMVYIYNITYQIASNKVSYLIQIDDIYQPSASESKLTYSLLDQTIPSPETGQIVNVKFDPDIKLAWSNVNNDLLSLLAADTTITLTDVSPLTVKQLSSIDTSLVKIRPEHITGTIDDLLQLSVEDYTLKKVTVSDAATINQLSQIEAGEIVAVVSDSVAQLMSFEHEQDTSYVLNNFIVNSSEFSMMDWNLLYNKYGSKLKVTDRTKVVVTGPLSQLSSHLVDKGFPFYQSNITVAVSDGIIDVDDNEILEKYPVTYSKLENILGTYQNIVKRIDLANVQTNQLLLTGSFTAEEVLTLNQSFTDDGKNISVSQVKDAVDQLKTLPTSTVKYLKLVTTDTTHALAADIVELNIKHKRPKFDVSSIQQITGDVDALTEFFKFTDLESPPSVILTGTYDELTKFLNENKKIKITEMRVTDVSIGGIEYLQLRNKTGPLTEIIYQLANTDIYAVVETGPAGELIAKPIDDIVKLENLIKVDDAETITFQLQPHQTLQVETHEQLEKLGISFVGTPKIVVQAESQAGGDPYVYPIHGSATKLPNIECTYRLFESEDGRTIINACVQRASHQIQMGIMQVMGNDTGLEPVKYEAFFFTQVFVSTGNEDVLLDLATKQVLRGTYGTQLQVGHPVLSHAHELYDQHSTSHVCIPIHWNQGQHCLNVRFSRNPQVQNGLQFRGPSSERDIGLLVRNYRPKLCMVQHIQWTGSIRSQLQKKQARIMRSRGIVAHREYSTYVETY